MSVILRFLTAKKDSLRQDISYIRGSGRRPHGAIGKTPDVLKMTDLKFIFSRIVLVFFDDKKATFQLKFALFLK